MKIKYLSLYGGSPDDGVNRKIMNQVTALIRLGLDVEMIIVTTDNTQFPSYDFLTVHTGRTDGIYVRMQRALKIRKVFKKTIESLDQRSILYYRCSSYFPLYYPINYLKLFRACKIVTEHQTVESEQLKLNRRHLGFLCEKIFGKFIRKQSDAMVGVTNEIAQYHLARAGDLKKPHITIGNGFDVESVNVRKPAPHLTENIHCLCVANFSRWHGADRFLRALPSIMA